MQVILGRVAFLANKTTAALDSSLESTMPAVTSRNGLVLYATGIPGTFFQFSQFSPFPFMLTCQTLLSHLLHQRFPNIFDRGPLCLPKITTDPHILPQENIQFPVVMHPNLKIMSPQN
jgi:hypothetical protein